MAYIVPFIIAIVMQIGTSSGSTTTITEPPLFQNVDTSPETSIQEGSSRSIHPFITCPFCDTFVECFFRCPFAEYPGINK